MNAMKVIFSLVVVFLLGACSQVPTFEPAQLTVQLVVDNTEGVSYSPSDFEPSIGKVTFIKPNTVSLKFNSPTKLEPGKYVFFPKLIVNTNYVLNAIEGCQISENRTIELLPGSKEICTLHYEYRKPVAPPKNYGLLTVRLKDNTDKEVVDTVKQFTLDNTDIVYGLNWYYELEAKTYKINIQNVPGYTYSFSQNCSNGNATVVTSQVTECIVTYTKEILPPPPPPPVPQKGKLTISIVCEDCVKKSTEEDGVSLMTGTHTSNSCKYFPSTVTTKVFSGTTLVQTLSVNKTTTIELELGTYKVTVPQTVWNGSKGFTTSTTSKTITLNPSSLTATVRFVYNPK